MKKLSFLTVFLFTAFFCLSSFTIAADAYVKVKGYYRSDGTYVAPHVRSNPNGLKYDNYSYTPSQGLYNTTYGTRGTEWDTPTTITDPDYYEGKALYKNGLLGSTNTVISDNVTLSTIEKTPTKHYPNKVCHDGCTNTVYQVPGSNTVWELSSWSYYNWGTRKPFTTAESFLKRGYRWSDIKPITVAGLNEYTRVSVYDYYF